MKFNELNLIAPLLRAVTGAGYETPTPIQEATIPLVLEGKDVLGCAQTGTGKTAAFALPILQKLYERRGNNHGSKRPVRALIVTPTRELATQISESFNIYGAELPLKCCVIFGGVKQAGQVEQIKAGVDIIVATPGRLNDLIGQGFIKLDKIEIFVLDEADRMLDMGFINDIKRILRRIPQARQTLLFSATMPPDVEKLAMTILHNPATVKVDPINSTVESISQSLFYVDKVNKTKLLAYLIKKPEVNSALVFTRTKHGADKVVRELGRAGIKSLSIHGNKSQNARQTALHRFMNGDIGVLVATDIAARGIDIPELSHVINYDIPEDPETYIHRIGRTGRAGLSGRAISFCCYDEFERLFAVEKLIGIKIPVTDSPWPLKDCTYSVEPRRNKGPARGQRQRQSHRRPIRRK
ncbi:MAG: DEAD/DEAH box helicase [Clostridiales bacterium]|nr:DEAD/DEAH box helicase [Clostridiales bacterium]